MQIVLNDAIHLIRNPEDVGLRMIQTLVGRCSLRPDFSVEPTRAIIDTNSPLLMIFFLKIKVNEP